ncbi:MAG: C39 family peptidase [Deltaproteobacteria bacterium]|nr:C39 family peptidase [Deltaproteobacteria bacterium]
MTGAPAKIFKTVAFFFTLVILGGCLYSAPWPQPFNSPMNHRLIEKVPFFPDNTILCGPATLAAVLTFQGRPTTVEEVVKPLLRTNLRGSLAPDLVILARKMGLKARFWAAKPEEIVALIDQGRPVILQIDSGLAIKTGHFVVALGYGPEGLVINTDTVKQSIMPWAEFLTRWLKFQNLAILVESPIPTPAKESKPKPIPEALILLDTP